MKNKKGKIALNRDIVIDNPNKDILGILFSIFYPIHIRISSLMPDLYIYYGYCEDFRELKEGEDIPEYQITFRRLSVENQTEEIGEMVIEKIEEIK